MHVFIMVQLCLCVNVKKTAAVSFLLSFIIHIGKYLFPYIILIVLAFIWNCNSSISGKLNRFFSELDVN